jgi:hypothetical protein
MKLIKALGSLRFAIILLALLVLLLTVSTVMESVHGTPFAQKVFYRANWFDFVLGLVWINIFCAAVSRYPFKKHHIGFVITHIGILTLLIGALMSRLSGVEGHMTLFEGEAKSQILQADYALSIGNAENKKVLMRLDESHPLPKKFVLDGKSSLTVTKILPHALEKRSLMEGPDKISNHAVEATLHSDTIGINETFVLVERHPDDPHSNFTEIGPAHFELKKKENADVHDPTLVIRRKLKDEVFSFEINEKTPKTLALKDLKISEWHYFPSAKISNNEIVNAPGEVRFNPAIQFVIEDSRGRKENHTRFFLFPDFGTLRGGEKNNFFDLSVSLDMPLPEEMKQKGADSPGFIFYYSPNHEWSYRIHSSRGTSGELPLEPGKKIATGWMDMVVTAKTLFNHALIKKEITEDKSGSWALRLETEDTTGEKESRWLMADQSIKIDSLDGPVSITLAQESVAVPFKLELKDFRKIDYPGTASPSSFESDVHLVDEKDNIAIDKKISMNKPLDYKEFRIFQSSYIQDPAFGEASVFTVAKNPGIKFIYSGAAIILIGVIILFYLHPFFNTKVKINDK